MDALLERFFGAWIAPELRLLGYRLRPYCLGAALLLEAIESPYAHLGEPVELTPADLVIALEVCSQARWPFQRVRIRPGVWTRFKAWYMNVSPSSFAQANALFIRWIMECSAGPEFWEDENRAGGGLTAPALLSRACSLLRSTTLTEERVWSMPAGLVKWYHGAVAEQEGAGTRFAYEADADEANNPPDLSEASEEELYAVVLADRGRDFADAWLETRRAAAEKEVLRGR